MKCLSCGYYEATHGSQCESCAFGDTGQPDPQRAQYDQFVNDSIEAQRLAQADEELARISALLPTGATWERLVALWDAVYVYHDPKSYTHREALAYLRDITR